MLLGLLGRRLLWLKGNRGRTSPYALFPTRPAYAWFSAPRIHSVTADRRDWLL